MQSAMFLKHRSADIKRVFDLLVSLTNPDLKLATPVADGMLQPK